MNKFGYISRDRTKIQDPNGIKIMEVIHHNETAQVGKRNVLQVWCVDAEGKKWFGKGTAGMSIQLIQRKEDQ